MAIPTEEEFEAAIETAKLTLKALNNQPEKRYPVELVIRSDKEAARKQSPINTSQERFYINIGDHCYRLKLYDDNSTDIKHQISRLSGIELEETESNEGAKCNKELVQLAKEDANIFADLSEQLAYELEQGYEIALIFKAFIIDVLRGDAKPKGKKKKNEFAESCYQCAIADVLNSHNLKLTRNDATTAERSVLDAVSQAAKLLGHKCEYNTLKRNLYPQLKDIPGWPNI